jgi:hypothetical protein
MALYYLIIVYIKDLDEAKEILLNPKINDELEGPNGIYSIISSAFRKEIFPKCLIFGVASIAFGVEGVLDEFLKFGKRVNSVSILVFIVVWFYFSFNLRKAKVKFAL